MPGWREMRRRAEDATRPIDALQERGKRAEAVILSLRAKFPNWRELPRSHTVSSSIAQYERVCVEAIKILAARGIRAQRYFVFKGNTIRGS
jgi:hypothetical protein